MSAATSSEPKFAKPAYVPILLAGAFMALGISFLVFLGREESRLRGTPLGEIEVQPLVYTEQTVRPEDQRGKVVVLHFWGVFDVPSLKEYGDYAKAQQEYLSNADVLFLNVACDQKSPESKDDLIFYSKKFLNREKIDDMPIYWDPVEYARGQVSHLFKSGGFGYPTTIVLDREGKIADVWRGAVKYDSLKKSIDRTLRLRP